MIAAASTTADGAQRSGFRRVEVPEGVHQRLPCGRVGFLGVHLTERVHRSPHLFQVGGAIVTCPEMTLETCAFIRRHNTLEIVGDQLDDVAAHQRVTSMRETTAERIEDAHSSILLHRDGVAALP